MLHAEAVVEHIGGEPEYPEGAFPPAGTLSFVHLQPLSTQHASVPVVVDANAKGVTSSKWWHNLASIWIVESPCIWFFPTQPVTHSSALLSSVLRHCNHPVEAKRFRPNVEICKLCVRLLPKMDGQIIWGLFPHRLVITEVFCDFVSEHNPIHHYGSSSGGGVQGKAPLQPLMREVDGGLSCLKVPVVGPSTPNFQHNSQPAVPRRSVEPGVAPQAPIPMIFILEEPRIQTTERPVVPPFDFEGIADCEVLMEQF